MVAKILQPTEAMDAKFMEMKHNAIPKYGNLPTMCWCLEPNNGEGRTQVTITGQGRHIASRIALTSEMGVSLDTDKVVHHLCDDPSCIRPSHLTLIPPSKNLQLGKAGGSREATPIEIVDEIVRLYGTKEYTQKELGSMFGLSHKTISDYCRGHRRTA